MRDIIRLMNIIIGIYVFILGTAFGSFALAMVDRMKANKDWVKGRSECDKCKHRLGPKDLVPLLSWLSTRGRCRYCKVKLSVAYPLTEILCGLAFTFSYIFLPYRTSEFSSTLGGALLLLWLLAIIIMTALVVFDLRWFLLPNKLVYPLQVVALVHRILIITNNNQTITKDLITLGYTLMVSAGIFYLLHIVSKGKWIGDGDVRLGVAMGLFLPGPAEAWLAIFVASLSGVIIALPAIFKNKKALKMKLPFGPMLIFGLFVAFIFGSQLIDWYNSTFLYI